MPPLLNVDGQPTFLLGINYWSRGGGPRMWERFDEALVRAELRQMRAIGLNVCRSFAFIPSFMPRPPALSRTALARFRRFLALCHDEGLRTIPTALVGHMSGENWDFPGQRGRSPYSDRTVLGWEKALVRGLAGCAARAPAVIAHLASNEMPLWGGPSDPETIAAWAGALREALREKDRRRPFGLGDAVINLMGGQNGFDPEALRGLIDFVGPHTYYTDDDPARQALNAEYCLRSLTYLGLPVLFEEFGGSSTQMSEENQVLYFREVIHTCLGVGAAGALGWCFSDLDLAGERPYSHHPFELGFGITRVDGSEKPVCDELRRIAALIQRVDPPRLRYPRPAAAILVPSYFKGSWPFSSDDRGRMRRVLLQSMVLCAGAGLEVELVPEGTDLTAYRLILCPATQKLLAGTWSELLRLARAGATVYWSFFMGDQPAHQAAWCPILEDLTGCRHQLRYGCYDLPADPLRLEGTELQLELRSSGARPYPRSFLPVEARDAEVLCRDGGGRPALTLAARGDGQVVFLAYPLEYYLSEQATGWEASSAFALYRWLATRAGLRPRVLVDDPGVQCRVIGASDRPLLWLFNHRWSTAGARVYSPGGEPLLDGLPFLDEGSHPIELPPKSAAVYRLWGEP